MRAWIVMALRMVGWPSRCANEKLRLQKVNGMKGRAATGASGSQAAPNSSPWSRVDWLLLLSVTALGAVLRFYKLGEVPPGFQFDEAFNAIDAAQVLHGNFPLFLPANGGREVLYTYLQAGLIWLLGVDVYGLRLASALLGIGAVAATFLLLRCLLQRDSRLIATFTSLTLAISVWHLHFSHYGIRVITMPLLLSALFASYWVGLHAPNRTRRWLALLICGLLTGLGVWTNPTGRFVPFILMAFTIWLLWRTPRTQRWSVHGPIGALLIVGVVALLVFLPLGLEFYRHPEWFTGHAAEVSIFAERVSAGQPWRMLALNIARVAGMFSFDGDPEWAHGPVNRPVFDPLLSIPFMIGVGLWISRLWQRKPDDPDVDALALLALWALAMLAPSVLSDAAPNYSRTLPSLPATFVAAGLGLTWVTRWPRLLSWAGLATAMIVLAISGTIAVYDYFVRYAALPQVYFAYEANKSDALAMLEAEAGEHKVYLHPLWAEHATIRALRNTELVKPLDTDNTLILPPAGQGVIYAYPPELLAEAERVAALWPGAILDPIADPYGGLLFAQVRIPPAAAADWPPTLHPERPLAAQFVDAPTLVGMQTRYGGQEIQLFWQAEPRAQVLDLTTFIHVLSVDGQRVAQTDKRPGHGSYSTNLWTPGEQISERYQLEWLDRCEGGNPARVVVGWYEVDAASGVPGPRRPRADTSGELADAGELLIPLLPYTSDDALPNPSEQPITPDLHLAGFDLHPGEWQPGAPLVLDLYWHEHASVADRNFMLQLSDGAQVIDLWSSEQLAPLAWPSHAQVCQRVRAQLPGDLAAGEYSLFVQGAAGRSAAIPLTIGPSTRQFALPPETVAVGATVGDAVKLAGYQVAQPGPAAEPWRVTLVWQALATPSHNYVAFVHLLDSAGNLLAQSDAVPAAGYATTRWVSGEIIVDEHAITLPADQAATQMRVGLYDLLSGERLPVISAAGDNLPDGAIILPLIP